MPQEGPPSGRIKTALFVDFDNIYLGLKRIDPGASERFATHPARWLDWMEMGMPGRDSGETSSQKRSMLIRKCYLNPKSFHKYRPYFTRCAFEVIDCPPLTAQGKNSSDIRMVMDLLDALEHPTHFDEFIILSGDADFTPVLLRLRGHDRRTAVLTVGPAAEAYKAACDRALTEDIFIEDALGISADELAESSLLEKDESLLSPALHHVGLLERMARAVYEEASVEAELMATNLPVIYRKFPEFRAQNDWLGFHGLRPLTEEIVRRDPRLRIVEVAGDTWRLSARTSEPPPATNGESQFPPATSRPPPTDMPKPDIRTRILACARDLVMRSIAPIPLPKASYEVLRRLGGVVAESNWGGAGSLEALLGGPDAIPFGLRVQATPSPGYILDPRRHTPSLDAVTERAPSELGILLHRVHQITGVPELTADEYAELFKAIAEVLRRSFFQLHMTSKAVRDLLAGRMQSVSRMSVTFVVRGILYSGFPLGEAPKAWSAVALGRAFRTHVLTMCSDAQLELTEEERAMMDNWLLGGLGGVSEEQAPAPVAVVSTE